MSDIQGNPLGLYMYEQVLGHPNKKELEGVREFTINHLFTSIWSRPGLPTRDRRLITIALLAAQGQTEQLAEHIRGAAKVGFSREEVLELMIQVAHYAGWASGTKGQEIAVQVFDENKSEADSDTQRLIQLNARMGKEEKDANAPFFNGLLDEHFIFRGANGDIVNKEKYLKAVKDVPKDPYERLETHVQEVAKDKETAVATVFITAKRKSMERAGLFRNVRTFQRQSGDWKLIVWINTKQG
jgi:4-carboxymuconolactone decarboxylase